MRLGDVCLLVTDGSHYSPVEQKSGYPMYSVKDMQDTGFNNDTCKRISKEDYEKLVRNRCKPEKNDVVVAKDGSFLKTAFVIKEDLKVVLLSSIAILRPDISKVYPEYLKWFLKSESVFRIVSMNYISGTALKRIILKGIKTIPIELPSMEEQVLRAEMLNKIQRNIELRKQQLAELDILIKARFVEMFGNPVSNEKNWKIRKLLDICTKLTDGTHFSPKSYEEGQFKYVTAKNIKKDGFDFSSITYVNEDIHRKIYERCNPEFGDVLYIKDGVTTGIAMVNTLDEEFTLLSSVALLKQDRQMVCGNYLCGVLNNESMYDNIRKNMGGAAITRLTIAKLNNIRIPVPPMEIQEQFASFVQQIDKSKVAVQKVLDEAQLLFDNLMQEYFG